MQTQTPYSGRSKEVVKSASIAAMVFLNEANTDMEIWLVRPQPTPESNLMTAEAIVDRKLREVGVIALNERGLPQASFKESLPAVVISAIAAGFSEYIRVLIGQKLTEQLEAAEISELERLYSLPDKRLIN